MPTATTGEIAIAYDDTGGGEALLLVHGHPFNRTMWDPQIDYLNKRGFRVVAPDLRGYGGTTVVAGVTAFEAFAGDLSRLLDLLSIDRAVLMGLSMGGQIVMEFQRLFPERVAGLVLADTSARAETESGKRDRRDTAARLLVEGMGPYAREALPKMVAPYNIEALPDVAAHVLEMMMTTSAQGAAAALLGRAERPDYVKILGEIRVPTLVIVGADDEFTPVEEAGLIHDHIQGSEIVVIDEAAHLPNLERQADFNKTVHGFLARHFAAE